MTKAESHYLNCQDENCEKAYCTDRREFTARLSRPKKESSKDRDIPKELRCGACGDDIRKPHSCTGETTQTEPQLEHPDEQQCSACYCTWIGKVACCPECGVDQIRYWKQKYLDARRSGYEEGREEALESPTEGGEDD